ncbi:hypothetical protein GJ700_00585 [Duganella sp. FT92W]|uniref:Uncharacterized protein n=1 Tax=Pseudoduganella rivuli TaxID=2666085 RepID=A0A7X2LRS0_9BURK|nr:hypothetical protein [Pseudoduganella rivuli]MRV70217.1 hypothetical protein [Pseudoduganella rivuli]
MFAIIVTIDACFLLDLLLNETSQRALPTAVRLALTIGLFTCVYKGQRWARTLSLLLFGSALVHAVFLAVTLNSLAMLAVAAVPAITLYVLAISPSVKIFLTEQKLHSSHH